MVQLKNISYFFIASFALVYILIYGQNLLIPLVIAFLLWFIIKQIRGYMEKIPLVKNRFPRWTKNLTASGFLILVIHVLLSIVFNNIKLMAGSYEKYQANTHQIFEAINQEISPILIQKATEFLEHFNFADAIISLFDYSTGILGNLFLVFIYALFFFLEEFTFSNKINLLFPDENKRTKLLSTLGEIEQSVSKYLGLKTVVSIITGLASFMVLWMLNIDFPVFWAFLIFVLNFIPNIGSLVATVFPAIFSMLQFGSIMPGIWVLIWVGSIQFLVGNLLEPKLMGNGVNLSPLIIILSLSFWGSIWGITGMLLSVPIMAIIVIILSKFPKTKPIAILLSANGIPEK